MRWDYRDYDWRSYGEHDRGDWYAGYEYGDASSWTHDPSRYWYEGS
jgi:hypothetical protein